ncbi:MAG: DNA mismatch repair endonuclease MutL [Nitrospiraceae bacterium]|nr:DNA mismatch repair endonuclease MutL [Nitrospiraceae bacterium]
MGKIKVLPPEVTDRLRAGEVIERPSGAVKELVENSLDAGAAHIKVQVKKGGKAFISVLDDGDGMGPEDALLSLERHATSKISAADDLFGITTLGFRGEALPSIAAVSDLVLTTAPAGAGAGLRIEARAGSVTGTRPAPALGTSVVVRELFFNTPARRKFLKSDAAENLHIINALTRQALSHPKTGFSLSMDGRLCMDLAPAIDERERIMQIYGAGFMEGLVEAARQETGFGARLFFSRDGNWRATRSHQFIFVNGRPVRDAGLGHAVYGALAGLPAGRHPVFFIFIEADPRAVDINVHPQKEEVRFTGRDRLYRLIRGAVADARRSEKPAAAILPPHMNGQAAPSAPAPLSVPEAPSVFEDRTVYSGSGGGAACLYPEAGAEGKKTRPFIRLGEMFYAYSEGQGVVLLDQHAAHERVMYEKLLKNIGLLPGQFLFPLSIELAPAQRQAVMAHRELLFEMGFEVEEFGGGSVILRSAPEEFLRKGAIDYASLLEDAAGGLLEDRESGAPELKKKIAARLACHGSVRGAEVLGEAEFGSLLDDLDKCEDPEHCPHGRPTRLRLDNDQLKKMFKRK